MNITTLLNEIMFGHSREIRDRTQSKAQKGPLATIKFPNMLVAVTRRAPTGPSQGTVMDHFGFKV